jgi:hypothetical protein
VIENRTLGSKEQELGLLNRLVSLHVDLGRADQEQRKVLMRRYGLSLRELDLYIHIYICRVKASRDKDYDARRAVFEAQKKLMDYLYADGLAVAIKKPKLMARAGLLLRPPERPGIKKGQIGKPTLTSGLEVKGN